MTNFIVATTERVDKAARTPCLKCRMEFHPTYRESPKKVLKAQSIKIKIGKGAPQTKVDERQCNFCGGAHPRLWCDMNPNRGVTDLPPCLSYLAGKCSPKKCTFYHGTGKKDVSTEQNLRTIISALHPLVCWLFGCSCCLP